MHARTAAALDEFDERIEFCKRHLSPTVDEENKYSSLQAEHQIRNDGSTIREKYSTIKECFRAKFFDPYREDSNENLHIFQTNGYDFQTKLNDVGRNVTKLVIEVSTTQSLQNFPDDNEEAGIHLNLTHLAAFSMLGNLWIKTPPGESFETVCLFLNTSLLNKNLPLKQLHLDVAFCYHQRVVMASLPNLTLLHVTASARTGPLLHDSLATRRHLRVLSVPELWGRTHGRPQEFFQRGAKSRGPANRTLFSSRRRRERKFSRFFGAKAQFKGI